MSLHEFLDVIGFSRHTTNFASLRYRSRTSNLPTKLSGCLMAVGCIWRCLRKVAEDHIGYYVFRASCRYV